MLGDLLKPDIEEILRERNVADLRDVLSEWEPPEIADLIERLADDDQVVVFRLLSKPLATDVFEYLASADQERVLLALGQERMASLLNEMSPDDRTELFEDLPGPVTKQMLALLSPDERRVALTLLGFPEDSIGRLMTPDYVAVQSGWTIDEVLSHVREVGHDSETLNVLYVVDEKGRLVDELRIREVLLAPSTETVADLVHGTMVALDPRDDQEKAVKVFMEYDLFALPVADADGFLLGIVTIDDVLDVAAEEATEDIYKIGAVEALDASYMESGVLHMVRKRAVWLIVLFLGQMLTANAMQVFQSELAQALVLVIFLPLIISSGGNSGSQAATLVVRAMALGEVKLRDWWTVMKREILAGLILGLIVSVIGFFRVTAGAAVSSGYGDSWLWVAITVALSLVGVVVWGTLVGSMLPFLLRRLNVDPATSSAPFVSTFVDVTGLVIYFEVAAKILHGTLL